MPNRFVIVLIALLLALTGRALLPDANAAPNFAVTTLPDGSVKLTVDDAAANDWFGYLVAVSGNTAVVGAEYDDHAGYASAQDRINIRVLPGGMVQSVGKVNCH